MGGYRDGRREAEGGPCMHCLASLPSIHSGRQDGAQPKVGRTAGGAAIGPPTVWPALNDHGSSGYPQSRITMDAPSSARVLLCLC